MDDLSDNIVMRTDSYKWTHPDMLPDDVTHVFDYLSARRGGEDQETVFYGLQPILRRYLEGVRVTDAMIDEAESEHRMHLAGPRFYSGGWAGIVTSCGGRLPIRICAVPEGTVVPCGEVLMTIENTMPGMGWLVGHLEGLLEKVWYPTTVATRSWQVKRMLIPYVLRTGGDMAGMDYMLHDFGYRGVEVEEAAGPGGSAHLLNFRGSDTLPAIRWARHYYGALGTVASSVAASEHRIMTAHGRTGEIQTALRIIASHENQIVSLVADSFDPYAFTDAMIANYDIVQKHRVRLVLRPDSPTPKHPLPEDVVHWMLARMKDRLPDACTTTSTGHVVTPYGVLWGDGIDRHGVQRIVACAEEEGFAIQQNLVFGMGGGLLQKLNRDTYRFKQACSAMRADGHWTAIGKAPLDQSKVSKMGRVTLVERPDHEYHTVVCTDGFVPAGVVLEPVFQDGVILKQQLWRDVQKRASSALYRYLAHDAAIPSEQPQEVPLS